MRVGISAGAAIGAIVLAAAIPFSAYAAPGTIVWTDRDGDAYEIDTPPDAQCVTFSVDDEATAAGRIENRLDRPIEVYEGPDCRGRGLYTVGVNERYEPKSDKVMSAKVWKAPKEF